MKPAFVCAWCNKTIRPGGVPVSHGICAACAGTSGMVPVEELATATPALLDRLPFGVIRLAKDGRIEAYSAGEEMLSGRTRAEVVGKNFYREVAPCTGVAAFQGEVEKLRGGSGGGRTSFSFVFKFPGGEILVSISATYNVATDTISILVQATP